jgi:hypothetical protein
VRGLKDGPAAVSHHSDTLAEWFTSVVFAQAPAGLPWPTSVILPANNQTTPLNGHVKQWVRKIPGDLAAKSSLTSEGDLAKQIPVG